MYTLALILGNVSQHWEVRFSACFSMEHAFLLGVNMLYEKRKLLIHRSIWFFLLFLGIIFLINIFNPPEKEVEIIDDNGYINEYYEYLNETNCEIEVVFNCDVDSGYITVAFYDSSDKLLSQETGFFYGYDNTLSSTFLIDGKVDSYEILSYDIDVSNDALLYAKLFIYIEYFIFVFFIASLTLSCNVYEYNGNEIVVYAGWYHHYIKVNGIKTDEHNTLTFFTAIQLSCTLDDGTDIKATITITNRISLKINNQLYTKRK